MLAARVCARPKLDVEEPRTEGRLHGREKGNSSIYVFISDKTLDRALHFLCLNCRVVRARYVPTPYGGVLQQYKPLPCPEWGDQRTEDRGIL